MLCTAGMYKWSSWSWHSKKSRGNKPSCRKNHARLSIIFTLGLVSIDDALFGAADLKKDDIFFCPIILKSLTCLVQTVNLGNNFDIIGSMCL